MAYVVERLSKGAFESALFIDDLKLLFTCLHLSDVQNEVGDRI